MSIAATALRVHRRARALATRALYRIGWETLEPGPVRRRIDFGHPLDGSRRAELVAAYRDAFAERVEPELAAARRMLEHRFHVLGHEFEFGDRIDWSRDPVSGKDWPRGYSPDIVYRGPQRLGDIKLPWELAKHQYFFTLGKAAWLSGEAAPVREIVREIDAWIADNPTLSGIHWTSALEAGARAVSWVLCEPFIGDTGDAEFRRRMHRSLAQHMLFVERNLSTGTYANTHLVGEAAALVVGGLYLDCAHADRWLRIGLRHLEDQVERQLRPDGGHVEQSIAYHRFFLDQYWLVDAFLRLNRRELPTLVLAALERATDYLRDTLFPDGSAPDFGDADDARGIWCSADADRRFRGLLAIAAWRLGRADLAAAAHGDAEEVLWLYGDAALGEVAAVNRAAAPFSPASVAYPDTGYYVLRAAQAQESMLIFDCGPLGYGPAGHGHADALSFQLFANGAALLVDAGTYSYNLDYGLRDLFKSSRAHNTVVVDREDQSVSAGRMSWSHVANTRCSRWIDAADLSLVEASHDGYARLQDPVTHSRAIVYLKPDVWLVLDRIDARAEHGVEIVFNAHPACVVTLDSGVASISAANGATALLRPMVSGFDGGELTLTTGTRESPPWVSEQYGVKRPSTSVVVRKRVAGHASFVTAITTCADVAVSAEPLGYGLRATVSDASRAINFGFRPGIGPITLDGAECDAEIAMTVRDGTQSPALSAFACTRLETKGVELRSETPVTSVRVAEGRVWIEAGESALRTLTLTPGGASVFINGAANAKWSGP